RAARPPSQPAAWPASSAPPRPGRTERSLRGTQGGPTRHTYGCQGSHSNYCKKLRESHLKFRRYAAVSSQARRMVWISVRVGCSGRAGRYLVAMRTRRSLVCMSAVEGLVLVRYQGRRVRWSVTSSGSWPVVAYQQTVRVWQARPNGTVRSTARVVRLWAWPTPNSCLASSMQTSIAQREA